MLALILTAAAQTATGPFVGDYTEGFESFVPYQAKPLIVFGGEGFLFQGLPGNAHVRDIDPVTGSNSFNVDDVFDGCCFGPPAQVGPEICLQFLSDMDAIGGTFRLYSTTAVTFRDGNGLVVGTTSLVSSNSAFDPYSWHGWTVTPFRSVCFYADGVGFRVDDLQVSAVAVVVDTGNGSDTSTPGDSGLNDTGDTAPPAASPAPFTFTRKRSGLFVWPW